MCDRKLDLLYSSCFNQMLRFKFSPTYVEKRILSETVNCVRNYLLPSIKELEDTVQEEQKRCEESYLTWDSEFYKKDGEEKSNKLKELVEKIKNTSPEEFLGEDFSVTGTDIDTLYPTFLPKSEIRQTLWEQWETLKEKHD